MDLKPRKLLDQVRDCLRLKQYAYRTEETYILFHNKGVISPLDIES